MAFFAVAVPLALAIASLRVDVIRLRYALAEAEHSERNLEERRRALVGEARSLRHPERLAAEARRLKFGPAHVVHFGTIDGVASSKSQPAGLHGDGSEPSRGAKFAALHSSELRR